MKKFVAGIFLVAVMALNASASHLIDHFSDGTFNKTATAIASPAITDSQSGLNDVIGTNGAPNGGTRDVAVNITKNDNLGIIQVQVFNGGTFHVFTDSVPSDANADFVLCYGDYTAFGDLDADFTGHAAFMLQVKSSDLAGGSVVAKVNTGGGGEFVSTATAIPGGPGNIFIQFNQFPAAFLANIGDVDGVKFEFAGADSWDVTLEKIETVERIPEPATMSLLGLGLLALARRRRKH